MNRKGIIQIPLLAGLIALIGYIIFMIINIIIYFLVPTTIPDAIITGAVLLMPERQEICHDEFCIRPEIRDNSLTGKFLIKGNVTEGYQLKIISNEDNIVCNIPKQTYENYNYLSNCNIKNLNPEKLQMEILKNGKELPLKVVLGKKIKDLDVVFFGKCLISKGKKCS